MQDVDMKEGVALHPVLLRNVIQGTQSGLMMAGIQPRAVGASLLQHASQEISILVACIGEHVGTMTLNVSQRAALLFASGMIEELQTELSDDVLDALGEIGNMIAGSIKDSLVGSELAFDGIACPVIVMAAGHDLYYNRGFTTVTVEFELEEIPLVHMAERIFSVTMSLMKR